MEQLIRQFNERGVRYLLIGGQAMRLEGMPRFSMDWDFFIPPRDGANFDALNSILADELPLLPLGPRGENFVQTYQTEGGIIQFHLAGPAFPPFEEAERRAVTHEVTPGIRVHCMHPADLLKLKEAANRPIDQEDILFLRCKLQANQS